MKELSLMLNKLLNDKNFKDFNPFLRMINSPTPFIDGDGTLKGSLADGSQKAAGTEGIGIDGSGTDVIGNDENRKAPVLDDNGNINLEEHNRNRKDIAIIGSNDESNPREAWVDPARKAVIINEGHRFYKAAEKSNNSEVKTMQLAKAIVDALAYEAADKPELANNYKEISDKKLNLINALNNKGLLR
jgi:hypothetical protein